MSCGATEILQPGQEGAPTAAVLLVGYGNLLRSDDGVGPAVVSRLAASFYDNPRCVCLMPHQLTPEVAEAVSEAERVVFVDASAVLAPGKVEIRTVDATGALRETPSLAHRVTPETVMALAEGVFGRAPRAWSVAVGVKNMRVGDKLSPRVSNAAGRLVRHLAHRIRQWSQPAPQVAPARKSQHECA